MTAAGSCLEHVGRLVTVFVDPGAAGHAARYVVRGLPVELCGKVVRHIAVRAFARPELELEPVSGKREQRSRNIHYEQVTFLAGRAEQGRTLKALGHLAGSLLNRDAVDRGREAAVRVAFAQYELAELSVRLMDLRNVDVLKLIKFVRAYAQHLEIFISEPLALFLGPERTDARRLYDRFVKEPGRLRIAHQYQHARSSGTLPEDRYVVGISAEAVDVVADELEGQDLVEKTVVLIEILIEEMKVQEAFEIQPVVEVDADRFCLTRKPRHVV